MPTGIFIGIAIGNGGPSISLVQLLINAFKIRIAADGGTFEAEACLQTILDKFNSIP
jgi:hypothetical protein